MSSDQENGKSIHRELRVQGDIAEYGPTTRGICSLMAILALAVSVSGEHFNFFDPGVAGGISLGGAVVAITGVVVGEVFDSHVRKMRWNWKKLN